MFSPFAKGVPDNNQKKKVRSYEYEQSTFAEGAGSQINKENIIK